MAPSDPNLLALAGPSKARRVAALDKLEGLVTPDVLATLRDIEDVKLDLVDSRNKERYLENVLRLITARQPEDTEIAAFHHLLGSLYINFEKFWGPTVRILIDLLKISRIKNCLLGHLLDQLIKTSGHIYNDGDAGATEDQSKDRPDHVLHRNFILQILAKFPDYVEANSVSFMDQLFLFAKEELHVSPFIEKISRQDLTSRSDPRDRCKVQGQKTKETMITMFRIVQSFQNMSLIHRQQEFNDLILDLLVCRDASVQKAAFNCLAVYNTGFIAPYMDKILKLLDERKTRSELSNFAIGGESNTIREDHRDQLVPIIQRILFGRMISRVDKKSAGRDKADTRKSIVMRYISGCTVDEIYNFFAILFDPIYKYIDCPYDKLEQTLREDTNITTYIPLNKLQAMLATLATYLETVAHQKEETLPHLLKLINVITYYVVVPVEEDEILSQIEPNCLATLKIMRRSCINIITEFFQSTQYYKHSTAEVDFIFKYIVWPSSTNFIDRNHATVTPILRLINSLVQSDVYHHLLVKRDDQDESVYLLQLIMALYNDPKIERPVAIYIARMIAKLLNIKSESDEEDEDKNDDDADRMDCDATPVIEHLLPKYDDGLYTLGDAAPIGLRMILRYTPIVFDRLRATCEKALEKKDTNFRLEDCELQVLSVLAGHIKDSSQCMLAARLLLSTLDSQKKGDVIMNTLKAVRELMKCVNESIDTRIIDHIASALSYQRNIEQRKELCNLVAVIARANPQLCSTSVALDLLNCTNKNLVEVPDLEKWGEGFRIAFEYLDGLDESGMNDSNKVRNSLILLIHQIGYIINTVDKYEFSVRENCGIFYEKLAQKILLMQPEVSGSLISLLVRETILEKFVKKGFRETNETIKHTYIGVARTLAMICNEKNPILNELYLFCDNNQDLDFWLNIRHIQLHNRSKALARIVASSKLHDVSSKTLSAYFMPLADGFLFNKTYKSLVSLSDNAIKLIGIICRNLKWVTYESTLSYYLGMLTKANTTYQRTNIKLITEIIKNFNFDITACAEAMQYEEENKKLEQRMRRRCGEHKDEAREEPDAPKARRLNPSTAKMVYYAVTKKLIPRLSSCLHEMTRVDYESDKNMADYLPEKDEIKRIPMAYAIVQLLSLLPGKYILLRDNLPALFLKLVSFLKSKNEDTRKAARATLMRMMLFVGPTYVPDMLRILKQNMDRGFHIHVLNYTVHAVLSKIDLGYGDLDSSSYEIVDLCKREIFGQPSEDKEVAKVVAKTAEARKTTGFDTLEILATHISAEKLDNLVEPFKSLLKTSSDSKTVNKLAVCIQRIWAGLAQNNQFPLDAIFGFIRASIDESLPNLRVRQQVDAAENIKSQSSEPLREDRFLIAKDKSKLRIKSRINEKGNLHMVVENSLRLLLSTFEKSKSQISNDEILQQKLDDFISLLTTCLKSSSPRCVTRSLKCLSFIAQTKIDLPSFKTKANSIVRKIFILLSLYNGVGMVQGDNYEMIAMCFKTLTLLLLKCEHVELEEKQIRALMSYIEQDLHDAMRQATAFHALNSILHKKCESPELPEVMDKVADLLVTSGDDSVRLLSIKIWQTYLLEYKHESSKLQAHLAKFLRQIDYEYIDGRKSVLGMLLVIVEKFPEPILRGQFELFFHLLAQRVVNDDSKEIRGIVGRLIVRLLQRLPETQDIVLVKFVLPWSSSQNLELKMLGIKLLSILVEASRGPFEKNADRIGSILAILAGLLEREIDAATEDDEPTAENDVDDEAMEIDENSSPEARSKQAQRVTVADKLAYHALRLFKRLLGKDLITCTETRHIEHLKKIWQNLAIDKLSHSHEPVVATACELYLIFISKTQLGQALASSDSTSDQYVNRNAIRIVRLLCDKFVELLDKYEPKNTISKYAMHGLIVLGQMVANSEAALAFERKYAEAFDGCDILNYMLNMEELPNTGFVRERLPYQMAEAKKRVDLVWLSVKVVMQARKEAAVYRLSQSYRRDFVLRWLAAISQELGAQRIAAYVFLFLMTPVRELTDKAKMKSDERRTSKSDGAVAPPQQQQNLVPLAQDLLKFIKGLVGVESFNKIYPKVQLHYTKRRINRKKNVAISRVRDQAHGVRRRLEEGRKKRDNNKRQLKRKRTA